MTSKTEIRRRRETFNKLCEDYPPKNIAEKNGLVLMACIVSNEKAMWDDFSDFTFSYNPPYFGEDDDPYT